jgi:hypothetical protein
MKLTIVFIGDECPTGQFPKDFTYKSKDVQQVKIIGNYFFVAIAAVVTVAIAVAVAVAGIVALAVTMAISIAFAVVLAVTMAISIAVHAILVIISIEKSSFNFEIHNSLICSIFFLFQDRSKDLTIRYVLYPKYYQEYSKLSNFIKPDVVAALGNFSCAVKMQKS